jgi:hypothetical protein
MNVVKEIVSLSLSLMIFFSLGSSAFLQESKQTGVEYKTYGAPARLAGEPMELSKATQPANLNKPIRVSAKVEEVCQNKGCWMILTDGTRDVRVTFKDYGFFVPKDIAGKTVIVEGIMSEKILPQERARHYAEDAGKSQAEIEKIVGDQKELAMVAETVLIPH